MKLLSYHPAAQAELEAEILYYERERPRAGSHLRKDIAETLAMVREFPAIGRCDEGCVRRIVTRRYRFVIHYDLSGDEIVVMAIAHPKREPGYWHSRRTH